MNYIITKDKSKFTHLGDYNYCNLEDMILPDIISFDSETENLKQALGDMFCAQIGTGTNNYLIVMYDNDYTPQDLAPYIVNRTLVTQNGTFDLHFLYKYGIYPKKVRDTFIMSKILYNGIDSYRHNFRAIFERELGIIYDKSEQKNIDKVKLSTPQSIAYCFQDVDRLLELNDHLEKKIEEGGFRETYELHCRYIRVLAYMMYCGLPIDTDKWIEKIKGDTEDLILQEQTVIQYIWDNFPKYRDPQIDLFDTIPRIKASLSSPKQMIPIFKEMGINVLTDEGKESIGEDTLNLSTHEFIPFWLKYQEAKHSITTFGQNILDKVINGRIYTSFKPILNTARISAGGKGDVNILNFPRNKRTRECIAAKPGYVYIVADYSGQETILGSDITRDTAMLASVINGAD